MSCEHDYEIISKNILESPCEQDNKIRKELNQWETRYEGYYTKKLVILLKCSKCKHLEKIVETNP